MINVFSFQKIVTQQDNVETKNISKTLHNVLALNQKKIFSQSKPSIDLKKLLSKHHQAKRKASKEKEEERKIFLNPLEESSQSLANIQSILYNKAFKIRCYSKRANKQLERENSSERDFSMTLIRSKKKVQLQKISKVKEIVNFKEPERQNVITMQKYDCPQSLKEIAISLKIYYNKQMKNFESVNQAESTHNQILQNQTRKIQIQSCTIVLNISELGLIMKISAAKSPQKQKSYEFYLRRIIITFKKTIQTKFNFQKESSEIPDLPQIIFKVTNQQEYSLIKIILTQCEFSFFYCIFYVQNKYVQSTSIFDMSQIHKLRSNIIIFDSLENFKNNPPFLCKNHNVAFCVISQKAHLVTTFQKILESSFILSDISNSFEKFILTNKKYGQIIEFPFKKLVEKARQRKVASQNYQKELHLKTKTQVNEKTQTNVQQKSGNDQKGLSKFKDKILMYLKIIQNNPNEEMKKTKHQIFTNNQQFQCVIGRDQSSKTNIQIVSELIRLNSNTQKQIISYQKETQNLRVHSNEVIKNQQKISDQIFINIIV